MCVELAGVIVEWNAKTKTEINYFSVRFNSMLLGDVAVPMVTGGRAPLFVRGLLIRIDRKLCV